MKIKGFGPQTIAKLELSSISELYSLKLSDASAVIGETMAQKLVAEVDAKRTVDFATFLSALGIPLIGGVAGKKIASVASGWEGLAKASTVLGAKARDSLVSWSVSDIGIETTLLPITFTKPVIKTSVPTADSFKGNVVITGKLDDYKNRGEAATYLESQGYTVTSGISKKTTYLIVEDGSTSSKTQKANDLNIPILTIKQLIGE